MNHQSVVIKINYANPRPGQTTSQPKMVTVWHVPRILLALTVLLGLLIWFWPSATDDPAQERAKTTETANLVLAERTPQSEPSSTVVTNPVQSAQKVSAPVEYTLDNSKPAAVIYDRHVLRAALVAEINNQQPGARLNPAIKIEDAKGLELYYFTEIKHPAVQGYAHHWLKDGHVVLKKNLEAKAGKLARYSSAKHFSLKDKGVWSVVLVNHQGKVLSESRFVVN